MIRASIKGYTYCSKITINLTVKNYHNLGGYMQRNFLVLYVEARFAMGGRNHVEELSYIQKVYDIRKKVF